MLLFADRMTEVTVMFCVNALPLRASSQNVPKTKCPKSFVKTSHFFCESKCPKYIFSIFNQSRDREHLWWTHWSKLPRVKTSQSQNIPSKHIQVKRPNSQRPRVKTLNFGSIGDDFSHSYIIMNEPIAMKFYGGVKDGKINK